MEAEDGTNHSDLEERIKLLEDFVQHSENNVWVESIILWTLFACIASALAWEKCVLLFTILAIVGALGIGAFPYTKMIKNHVEPRLT